MDGFEVGFEPWVAVAALEAAGADDFFACQGAEDGGDDFVCGRFVVLFELAVVFFEGFSVQGQLVGWKGLGRREREDVLGHVELCCDFFFACELHDEVLVECLALADGGAQSQL